MKVLSPRPQLARFTRPTRNGIAGARAYVSPPSDAVVAGEDGPRRSVRTEIIDALDRHDLGQSRSRPIDAALDGGDRAPANLRGLLIGEAGRADENQRFALIARQFGERHAKFLEFHTPILLGMR